MSIENAEICSEYAEFPELDDLDFQKLARSRVRKLMHAFMPADHPEAAELVLEVWMDGLATGLRMSRED